ncbi:UDP-glucuronosyl/UDP-glucosyltransferase [Macleaya cordata]|uniref:Glycosyltransferase n=1 Tax=Macleaya cordata TaxID=56857 RepID=A0A200QZ03_MACCD|nr:UDP-glucuronosyl/UDP-glucosyltransferase [Macleaya cordata]
MNKKKQLVFVPAPGIGHLASMVEVAKNIINRYGDHLSITVLILKPPFHSSNLLDSYIHSLSTSITSIHFLPLSPPSSSPISSLDKVSIETFISVFVETNKTLIKDTITNLIMINPKSDESTNPVQLVGLVVDLFYTAVIDVGNELGVPTYLYFTSSAAFLGLMLHLPILHTQITTEFKDSDIELKIPSFVNSVPPSVLPQPLLNKKDDGYTWFVHHGRRFRETKGIMVNTFSDLEPYPLDSFLLDGQIPPVYPVGPLIDLKGQTQLQPDQTQYNTIMKWLDDQPPSSVILLCFGSMGSFDEQQVTEIAVGLERSGHRFLWSLREPAKTNLAIAGEYTNLEEVLPHGFLERTKGIGLVCGWVPQVSVLGHQAIGGFVSHCGWNSILESLWFGVPIVTWPLYAEQQVNAFEMVKELGLAVELRLDYRKGSSDNDLVVANEIERGVKYVMDMSGGNEVRKKVKKMREKSRKAVMDKDGSSYACLARLIESLIDGISK